MLAVDFGVENREFQDALIQNLKGVWQNTSNDEVIVSKIHQDIGAILDILHQEQQLGGLKYEISHFSPSGMEVDILIT